MPPLYAPMAWSTSPPKRSSRSRRTSPAYVVRTSLLTELTSRSCDGRRRGGNCVVIALVFQIELMSGAKSFARNLPRADRIVAHEDAFAAALENDVAALRALFPNGVGEIAVHIHIVVFHRADAEKIIQRQIVKMRDVENVRSEPQRLMMSERLRRARALADDAPVGLRFENKKIRESGQKLKGRKRFQFLLGWNVVGVLEHAALLLRESEILPCPGDEFVVRDEAMRFHSIETRDGGELIVFNEHINFVVRALAVVPGDQKDFRGFVRIASAQILVAKKGFELVVERSDFRASHFVRERKSDISALELSERDDDAACRCAYAAARADRRSKKLAQVP